MAIGLYDKENQPIMGKPMQIREASRIATDCIRGAMKRDRGNLKYKWIRPEQKEQLEIRIAKYKEAIEILELIPEEEKNEK